MPRNIITAAELAERHSIPPSATLSRQLDPLIWMSDVKPVLAQAGPIRGLIAAGSFVVIYGDAGCGKTFFTLDLVMHVAAGQPWRGHRVTPGLVIYVGAEAGRGILNRLAAIRAEALWTKAARFALLPQTVDLLDPGADTGAMIDLVKMAEGTAGETCSVIVLDTLARVMPGGDENGSADMGAFIANVDRLRTATQAAVIAVHHCGKDQARGARGHSSLRAAVDTEIVVEGLEGARCATVRKQRDLPSGQSYGFMLVPVEIGRDPEDGTPVTSCIVAITDAPTEPKKGPTGKQQIAILRLVETEAHNGRPTLTSGELVRLARERLDMPKSSARSAVLALTDARFLVPSVGGLTLPNDPP